MRTTRWVVPVLLFSPGLALADPCTGASPFDDVPALASYCSNTEWLRNRSITLGCTATTYCPNEPVTRAAMALFMNRLGSVLTPDIVVRSQSGNAIDLEGDTFVCVSSAYAPADYPRRMHLVASFSAHTTAAAAYDMNVRYNTDGSPSDFAIPVNGIFQFGASPVAGWSSVSASAAEDIAAGTQYRFAMRVSRASVSGGTGNIDSFRCHLSLAMHNRNAVSPPLDATAPGVVGTDE